MSAYDLLVLGSGPGGYVAALRGRQLGLRVGLVERTHLGGICLNWGCIPTKSMLKGADLLHHARAGARFGLRGTEQATLDPPALLARSREVSGQLGQGVAFLLRKAGVDVIWGEARLSAPGRVEVAPSATAAPRGALPPGSYEAANVVVATGASPRRLPGLEPDGDRIWTYFDALRMPEVPASLAILGSGAIGVEFAGIYAALGARVTVIEQADRVLPQEDAEISEAMARAMARQGIAVLTGTTVTGLERTAGGLSLRLPDGRRLDADRLLSAAGVVPNAQGLGLEALGVATDRGAIRVDADGRSSVPGLWAIGDVTGAPMLAHRAEHQGIRCAEAIAERSTPRPHGAVPSCIYARPQVASVGLTEAAARQGGRAVAVGRFALRGNGKAIVGGEAEGFAKTVFDAGTGRLLGAHLIGPDASELVHGLAIALALGATRDQLAGVVFPHPTLSEALHESVLAAGEGAIHA